MIGDFFLEVCHSLDSSDRIVGTLRVNPLAGTGLGRTA